MAKKIIAQKFGGTSVSTPESRQLVVGHIRRTISEGYSPVIVASAMGRRGAPYATDTLLDFIHAQGEPVSGRDEDLIFHCGEVISVAILSHRLNLSGIPAVGLTGGQARVYTDGRWRRAKIVRIDPTRMLEHVERGEIPVVAGGQGISFPEGEITILGRGASDTSGVAVGVAVGAEKIEIYTDVPGVAIADPRVVPQARFLKEIAYEKLYEMGIFGARVMHPGAALIGQRGRVPIVCRSTFMDVAGTLITETREEPELVGIPSMGPVILLAVYGGSPHIFRREELFDRFAAVAMQGKAGVTVVAVAPDWRKSAEDYLTAEGGQVDMLASGRGLVSLVGSPEFIAANSQHAQLRLEGLGIAIAFWEQAEIRTTFAIPMEETPRAVRALYEAFVSG